MADEVFFHVCQECVSRNPGCCIGNSVPYTMGDVKRITALGHDPHDFLIAGEYGKAFTEGFEPWWVDSFVPRGNYYYKLNTRAREDGSCVFLIDGKGCTLGDKRPAVCRLYPFWVDDKGEVIYEHGEDESCDIPRRKFTIDEGLALIEEDRSRVREYFGEIKQDCENNHTLHEQLIDELLAKKQ